MKNSSVTSGGGNGAGVGSLITNSHYNDFASGAGGNNWFSGNYTPDFDYGVNAVKPITSKDGCFKFRVISEDVVPIITDIGPAKFN